MEEFDKYESFKSTVDMPFYGLKVVHDFKKLPDGVNMRMRWIINDKEDLAKRSDDFMTYEQALKIINKHIKDGDNIVEARTPKILKGYRVNVLKMI